MAPTPPPPAYSLIDQNPSTTASHRRHSYHPITSHSPSLNHHHHQFSSSNSRLSHPSIISGSNPPATSSRPGRSSQSLSFHPATRSSSTSLHYPSSSDVSAPIPPTDDRRSSRGLGGLLVGLGAAAMLNNTLNSSPLSSHPPQNLSSSEDPLSILRRYDTILLIDDSASMSQQNRWAEAGLAVSGLAQALVQYDSGRSLDQDGIDVYFMNSLEHLRNALSAPEINRLFERVRPVGRSTPTDVRVEELLGVYLDRLEYSKINHLPPLKPLNLIVITDGEADDPDTLAYALAGFAERLDQSRFPLTQLGVQFIQIGNDPTATRFLRSLDDDLRSNTNSKRDIVDTTPYQGRVTTDFLVKALLGGINKRIDHQRCSR